MDIKEIIRQHPKSVAVVFKRRGINAPVTAANVMLQTVLGKDEFIDDLCNQIEDDGEYTNDNGSTLDPVSIYMNSPVAKSKIAELKASQNTKSKSEKVKNTLRDFLGIVGGTFGAYKAWRGTVHPTSTATPGINGAASDAPSGPSPEQIAKKKSKMLLIGGIALIVILVIAVLTTSKK